VIHGLLAVLFTQASTWQWVAFKCLIPGYSAASGAVLQSILVMLLPGELLLLLVLVGFSCCCCCCVRLAIT
jgi:hypothetical protein